MQTPEDLDRIVASFDDKRLRTLFTQLREDIDGLTSLDIHRSQQIRDLNDTLFMFRQFMTTTNKRIESLEIELRELQGEFF